MIGSIFTQPNRLCPNRHLESFQLQHLKSRILPGYGVLIMLDAGYLRSIYWDVVGYTQEKVVVFVLVRVRCKIFVKWKAPGNY
jgi:hypothetical protein